MAGIALFYEGWEVEPWVTEVELVEHWLSLLGFNKRLQGVHFHPMLKGKEDSHDNPSSTCST